MSNPAYLLLAAMAVLVASYRINQYVASPVLAIVNRWYRWIIFSLGMAYVASQYFALDRPYWVLAVAFFLVWFLLETFNNWLAIHALSVSALPLFPRYTVNTDGDQWPIQRRLLKMREWLRQHGFHPVQALKAELGGGFQLRVSVYQDAAGETRAQVVFLPQRSGTIVGCCVLSTQTVDGRRFVTDNLCTPFAGFYPETWLVKRLPWCRSLARLVRRHQSRARREGGAIKPWTDEPINDLNDQQHELDRINTELGFLHPRHERDNCGKITQQGRYRVWKEVWMLDYLGRAKS